MQQIDRKFLTMMAILVVFGLIMLTSASGPVAYQKFGDSYWYVKHQLLFGLLPGVVVFFLMSSINYRFWRRVAKPVFALSIGLLLLVFVPGIGAEWGTSRSWIGIGSFSLQPAETVKLSLLIFLAAWLDGRTSDDIADLQRGFLPFLAILGAVGLLIMLQPDLGSLSVIVGISVIVYLMAGAPWRHLAALAVGGAAVLGLLVKAAPYRAARLTTFLHPDLDPQGIGYHINQAFLAIGSGGVFGLGLGHSRQKYMYLPEVVGDSIFAVTAEELGFVMCLVVLGLMAAFLIRITVIARRAPDSFGRLLAVGVAGWLFSQMMINIGGMVGIFPMTGLPLPFVSYGGTALMVLLAGMGVVANISRQSQLRPKRRTVRRT